MEKEVFLQLAELERDNWWYRARRDLLDRLLSRHLHHGKAGRILDAGCGAGSNFETLARHSPQVSGVDVSADAAAFCAGKGYREIVVSSLQDARFDGAFDAIVCMDVLEHIDNDRAAVARLKSLLNEDGLLIISVPAHKYLWGENDQYFSHKRRYSPKDLRELTMSSGLSVVKLGYWNQFMLLPVLLYKAAGLFRKREPRNNLDLVPSALNGFLYRLLAAENALFCGPGLLNGVSLVCVCRNAPPARR